MGDRLATTDMDQKVEAAVPLSVGRGRWVPIYNTMSPGPTSVPSGILIHPAVWHNIPTLQTYGTYRQDSGPVA